MNKSSNILITGATGFLGSYICRKLWASGYRNIHATRRSSSTMDMLPSLKDQINWHEIALDDGPALRALFAGVDIVIHAAGFVSHMQKDFDKLCYVNGTMTKFLVDTALSENVKQFIFISSIAALGRTAKKETIDERAIWKRSKYNSGYAISKYLGEMEVWRAQAEGLNTATICPSVILGAGDWKGGSLGVFKNVFKGNKFYPTGSTGWVDVRDVASAVHYILSQQISNERFIISGQNESFQKVLSAMAKGFGKKPPKIAVTPVIAEMAWRVAVTGGWLTRSEPIVNKFTARISQNEYTYDNTKSIDQLEMLYRPLSETINESCAAFLGSLPEKKSMPILPF